MNNKNDFIGSLTIDDYEALLAKRDEINRIIKEYEHEYRRGNVKVFESRSKKYEELRYSLRYNSRFNEDCEAYWVTICTKNTKAELLEVMKMLSEDIPAVYEAYKEAETE